MKYQLGEGHFVDLQPNELKVLTLIKDFQLELGNRYQLNSICLTRIKNALRLKTIEHSVKIVEDLVRVGLVTTNKNFLYTAVVSDDGERVLNIVSKNLSTEKKK